MPFWRFSDVFDRFCCFLNVLKTISNNFFGAPKLKFETKKKHFCGTEPQTANHRSRRPRENRNVLKNNVNIVEHASTIYPRINEKSMRFQNPEFLDFCREYDVNIVFSRDPRYPKSNTNQSENNIKMTDGNYINKQRKNT